MVHHDRAWACPMPSYEYSRDHDVTRRLNDERAMPGDRAGRWLPSPRGRRGRG